MAVIRVRMEIPGQIEDEQVFDEESESQIQVTSHTRGTSAEKYLQKVHMGVVKASIEGFDEIPCTASITVSMESCVPSLHGHIVTVTEEGTRVARQAVARIEAIMQAITVQVPPAYSFTISYKRSGKITGVYPR